jgi:hypothetical protein
VSREGKIKNKRKKEKKLSVIQALFTEHYGNETSGIDAMT